MEPQGLHVSAENADRLVQVIQEFGFGELDIEKEDFLKPKFVIQLGMAPNRIDILTGIDGLDWDEMWESKIDYVLDGLMIHVIGKAQLIKNKLASGRTQDLADAERLLQGK